MDKYNLKICLKITLSCWSFINTLLFIFHYHVLWNNWISNLQCFPMLSKVSKFRKKSEIIPGSQNYSSSPPTILLTTGRLHFPWGLISAALSSASGNLSELSFLPVDKNCSLFLLSTCWPQLPGSEVAFSGRQRFWTKNPHHASNLEAAAEWMNELSSSANQAFGQGTLKDCSLRDWQVKTRNSCSLSGQTRNYCSCNVVVVISLLQRSNI